MEPTLTALIVAATSLIGNLALLVKVITDKVKLTNERAATAAARDKAEQEIRDAVLKHGFQIGQLKDQLAFHNTVMTDMQQAMSELNVNCAKLSVVVEQLADTVKELKNV